MNIGTLLQRFSWTLLWSVLMSTSVLAQPSGEEAKLLEISTEYHTIGKAITEYATRAQWESQWSNAEVHEYFKTVREKANQDAGLTAVDFRGFIDKLPGSSRVPTDDEVAVFSALLKNSTLEDKALYNVLGNEVSKGVWISANAGQFFERGPFFPAGTGDLAPRYWEATGMQSEFSDNAKANLRDLGKEIDELKEQINSLSISMKQVIQAMTLLEKTVVDLDKKVSAAQ